MSVQPHGNWQRIAVALGVTYPLLAHWAIVSRSPRLVAASVGLLCTLLLLEPLRRGRLWAWSVLAASGAGLWAAGSSSLATLPLLAPPVLITGGVAWFFGQSLRRGATPLIEQIARIMEGAELGEAQRTYARHLTVAWAALTGTLCVVNLGLALLAEPGGLLAAAGVPAPVTVPLATWSLFANVINYLVLGAMFAIEFAYRRHRFRMQRNLRFVDFIQGLVRLGPLLGRGRPDR